MNFAQVIVNSLITASELGLIAIGLTLTFSLLKFGNFAHVEMAVAGAYTAWALNTGLGLSFALSLPIAAIVMGFFGIVVDRAIFRVFRNAGDIAPMIAALGLAIAIRYSIQAIFGPHSLRYDFAIAPGMKIAGAYVTRQQIWILAIVVCAMLGFHLLLQYTAIGKAMRATSTNVELAQASGVNTERVIAWVWFLGTGFAGLGGVLVAWDTQLVPDLGFNIVIPAFCVVLMAVSAQFTAPCSVLWSLASRSMWASPSTGPPSRELDQRRGDLRLAAPAPGLQTGDHLRSGDPAAAAPAQRPDPPRTDLKARQWVSSPTSAST